VAQAAVRVAGSSNARTEGINRVIKDVGRRACGSVIPPTTAAGYGSTAPEITPSASHTSAKPA
jgi:hypothetical protein